MRRLLVTLILGVSLASAAGCADLGISNPFESSPAATHSQLLGIGLTGHIGFNEPADEFKKGTNCVDLDPKTIESNSRFFQSIDDVPKQAYTMGIQSIMKSKKILLIANGEGKAEILYKACCGAITPHIPASVLQLHPDVVVVADDAALKVIKEKAPEAING